MQISQLEPQSVWAYFEQICAIPHPSMHEQQLVAYLRTFAEQHGLACLVDTAGNVLIRKPATPGYEQRRPVVLQSHLDMVCEKNQATEHDFLTDPIRPYIDGGWVRAQGTTLGADDGIGMAAQLAVLADNELVHGPLECLFTANEEAGMTGALGLDQAWLQGRTLLNLDSEDDGQLFIGCAGGIDTLAFLPYKRRPQMHRHAYVRLDVQGLQGGHSGDDIHRGLGNAVKLLNRFLWLATRQFQIRLAVFEGGNLRNAIAREAYAVVAVPQAHLAAFEALWARFSTEIAFEYRHTEAQLQTRASEAKPCPVLSRTVQQQLLGSVYACPHGELVWDKELPNLVQTSTNLASVRFEQRRIVIATSQRSSVPSALNDVAAMVRSVFELAGAKVQHGEGYPGWTPNLQSALLAQTREAYRLLFGDEPQVRAIHAGLECGLLQEKYPDMDLISFGPTVRGAHSPDERIEIRTVDRFWRLLVQVLAQLS